MEKKVVQYAVPSVSVPQQADATRHAVELLVAKDGVFRTSEKWVYASLRGLIDSGHVKVSGTTLSVGADFESHLLKMSDIDAGYTPILRDYRRSISEKISEYNVSSDAVMDKITHMPNTDEKIIYLTSVLADAYGKLEKALEKTAKLEATLHELDISLSVMESMTFDENTDG